MDSFVELLPLNMISIDARHWRQLLKRIYSWSDGRLDYYSQTGGNFPESSDGSGLSLIPACC